MSVIENLALGDLMGVLSTAGGGGVIGVIGTRVFDWGKSRSETKVNNATEGKIDAEAAEIIARAAAALVIPLEAQIKILTCRVDAYVDYIQELHIWIGERIHEVPPPPPIILDI